MNRRNAWTVYTAAQQRAVGKFADDYKSFLDSAKTEREAVETIVNAAEAAGFTDLKTLVGTRRKLKKGDKVYSVWMNKTIVLFKLGSEPFETSEPATM